MWVVVWGTEAVPLSLFHHLSDQSYWQRTDIGPVFGEVVADHGQLRHADDFGKPVAIGVPMRCGSLVGALPVCQAGFGSRPRTFPCLVAESHGPLADHRFLGVVVVVERRG